MTNYDLLLSKEHHDCRTNTHYFNQNRYKKECILYRDSILYFIQTIAIYYL